MTPPTPKPPARVDSRVPASAPIRRWQPAQFSRDQWDALKAGLTIEQVKASRSRILATDAKEAGA